VNIAFSQPISGTHKLYFVFVNPSAGPKALFALDKIQFMQSAGGDSGQGK
jgi:cytochrome c